MIIIEVRNRRDDFHAQIKGMPTHWGCGRTEAEAVGDLVKTHSHSFDFTAETITSLRESSNEIAGIYVSIDKKLYDIEIEKL